MLCWSVLFVYIVCVSFTTIMRYLSSGKCRYGLFVFKNKLFISYTLCDFLFIPHRSKLTRKTAIRGVISHIKRYNRCAVDGSIRPDNVLDVNTHNTKQHKTLTSTGYSRVHLQICSLSCNCFHFLLVGYKFFNFGV